MAEDFNHIDQIIRQKFENFEPEPPVQVWEKIRSGLEKTPPPSSPGIILPIIVTISLLIFIGGLLNHFYHGDSNFPVTESATLSIQSAGVISTGSTTTTDLSMQEAFYQASSEVAAPGITSTGPGKEQPSVISVRVPFEQNAKVDRKKKTANKDGLKKQNTPPATGQWKPGLVQALSAGQLSYTDALKYELSPRDIRKLSGYSDYAKKSRADWSLGVYFNPEVTYCQDVSIENTVSYNVGILPRVSFNRFFIQSGINMRFTHDKGNLAVDYNRYLGTYEHVDYMTFDSIDGIVVPTYHTHTEDVFDTVNHYAISDTKVNYTYLEVPLLFGYRYSFGKFSISGKAGPAASFLVFRNLPGPEDPEENARITDVDYQVPVRYDVNWQLLMGVGFDYQLAEKFNIGLEPTFRMGLKPEYKLSDGIKGNTSSFGIRIGLNYNF